MFSVSVWISSVQSMYRWSESGVEMTEKTKNLFSRMSQYVGEVQGEFNKITWPPQAETLNGTISVVIIVSLIATYLGVVDFGLSRVMKMVLG